METTKKEAWAATAWVGCPWTCLKSLLSSKAQDSAAAEVPLVVSRVLDLARTGAGRPGGIHSRLGHRDWFFFSFSLMSYSSFLLLIPLLLYVSEPKSEIALNPSLIPLILSLFCPCLLFDILSLNLTTFHGKSIILVHVFECTCVVFGVPTSCPLRHYVCKMLRNDIDGIRRCPPTDHPASRESQCVTRPHDIDTIRARRPGLTAPLQFFMEGQPTCSVQLS